MESPQVVIRRLMKEPRVVLGDKPDPRPFNLVRGLYQMCLETLGERADATIAEVGCYAGVSTELLMQFCRHGGHLYAIDKWQRYGDVVTEPDIEWARGVFYARMEQYGDLLTVRTTSSLAASSTIERASLDLLYLDARHEYPYVCEDLDAWTDKVKHGGWICGHDYHQPGVYKAVREKLGMPWGLYPDMSWSKRKE